MKKRILFLLALIVLGSGIWIIAVRSRPADHVPQPPSGRASASVPQPQEPVGWVFGRLLGVRQTVYAPPGSAPSVQPPLQAPPPPKANPAR